MALVTMLGAMLVAVVMPATAVITVSMRCVVMILVVMRLVVMGLVIMGFVIMPRMVVLVIMVGMIMTVAGMMVVPAAASIRRLGVPMVMSVIVMVVAMVIGAALGLEGARHRAHGAALAADHLRQDMVVLDIDRVAADLGRGMAVADMPGQPHQAQRVLGADLEQALGGSLDHDQSAVLEPDRVTVAKRGRLVQVEQDIEPAIALEREAAAIAILMVERQRLDDLVCFNCSLANDGGGTQHDV
jgi:hypothetical protein